MRNIGRMAAALLLLAGFWTASFGQLVWDSRAPLTQSNNLNGVTWTGSRYVAVGIQGTIVTSTDGVTWDTQNSGVSLTLYAVTWTGSRLVAVGQNGTILTSTSGTSWSAPVSSPPSNSLFAVTWSASRSQLVAVGSEGTVLESSDGGLNWTAIDNASVTTAGLNGVTWSPTLSLYVAVGNSSVALTSPDGTNWTLAGTGGGTLYAVTWTGGEFLAVGTNGVIRSSPDGTAWVSRASGGSSLLAVALGSRLVALGNSGTIRQAPNTSTWTLVPAGVTQNLASITWSGAAFLAVGTGGVVLTSPDGLVWTQTSSVSTGLNALTSRIATVPVADTLVVAVGSQGTILTSANGTDWTKRISSTSSHLYGVTWTGSAFMAVGAGAALVMSPDGVTWTASSTLSSMLSGAVGSGSTLWGIASTATGNYVVAVGQNTSGTGVIAVSTNGGTSWAIPSNMSFPSSPNSLHSVTWTSGNTFVAVGVHDGSGSIRRSTSPLVTWSLVGGSSIPTDRLNSVTYTGSQLVAVGEAGKILSPPPGTGNGTWSSQISGTSAGLKSVTWTGSQYVAVGSGGTILTSPNLTDWDAQISGTSDNLYATRWDGRLVTAVGTGGKILTSSPAALPAVPVLTAPAQGAGNIPVNPAFSWNGSSGATSYDLQLSTSPAFSDTLVDTVVSSLSFLTGPLTTGASYSWRVRANGSSGSSAWSGASTFTVIGAVSAAPVLTFPSNNATDIPLSTTLLWNAYTGAASYRVQLSTDQTFATQLVNDSLASPSRLLGALSPNTVYYWRVYARLSSGITAWSAVSHFTTTPPAPPAPVLSTPANNASAVPLTATLTWSTSTGASGYRVQVSTAASFSTTLRDTVVTGATSLSVPNLTVNGVYYWRVRAQNGAGSSAYSAQRTFTTATSIPAPPALLSPAASAIDVPVLTGLSWAASSGAMTYHVQFSTDQTFSTMILDTAGLTETSRNPGQLLESTTYYWRVSATNPLGTSQWSATRAFLTGQTPTVPPPAPTLSAPAQFTSGVPVSSTLSWNAAATASSYRVQVSIATSFANLVVDDTLTALTRAVGPLSGATNYYWRVHAANQIGAGDWSETRQFTTVAVVPGAPEPLLPAQFSTGVAVSPTLTWGAVSSATSYRVQVSTSSSFVPLVLNDSLSSASRTLGPLVDNTDYYWRVNARNTAGVSAYSSVFRFTTGVAPLPEAPVLLLPAQFATDIPRASVTLSWAPAIGANSYRVQTAATAAFTPVLSDDSGVTATSRPLAPLPEFTVYYWRVSSKNSTGSSAFSMPFRFTTDGVVALLPDHIVVRSLATGGGRALRFGLPRAERVTVRAYDTRGNLKALLADGVMDAGYHALEIPSSLRGGVLLLDFRAGSYRAVVKTLP